MEQVRFVCSRCDNVNPCYMHTILKYSKLIHPTDCPFGGRSAVWQKTVDNKADCVDYRELKPSESEDNLLLEEK